MPSRFTGDFRGRGWAVWTPEHVDHALQDLADAGTIQLRGTTSGALWIIVIDAGVPVVLL